MQKISIRALCIYWLYFIALVHVLAGIVLPWLGNSPLFETYYHTIEAAFWPNEIPEGARALQVWWISLFGPSIQTLGIWMIALTYLGNHYRNHFAWGFLFWGFIIWAPQDIVVSLRADAWMHVWLDLSVLAIILPPLVSLWLIDRKIKI